MSLVLAATLLVAFLSGIIITGTLCFRLFSSSIHVPPASEKGFCRCQHVVNGIQPGYIPSEPASKMDKRHGEEQKDNSSGSSGYKRVHQRLNKFEWIAYNSDSAEDKTLEFIVYHRHSRPGIIPAITTLLKIESSHLKKVLKDCVQYSDSVFDSEPLVFIIFSILI